MTRVLILRGHQVTPWELGPWGELPDDFEVSYLLTGSNRYAPPGDLDAVRVRSLRDLLPRGVLGEVGAHLVGDRYLSAEEAFAWADVVHGEELSYWFAAEAARRRRRHRFRLVQTVWETLPLLDTYRNRHARRNRALVLAETDLFLAATERAAQALRLEGVPAERIEVCPLGVDVERFAAAGSDAAGQASKLATAHGGHGHTILSPGRLVWEKGHQDVLRALAALARGLVPAPGDTARTTRVTLIGAGPERRRLLAYAGELGVGGAVEVQAVPYERMPQLFASASAMVLASLPLAGAALHPLDVPRAFWEEQFGYVLVEAMAAGLAIVASTSGAIPEVLAGTSAQLVAGGDWLGIARALADGPLARAPAARVEYPPELVRRNSLAAAAERLARAYERLLAS